MTLNQLFNQHKKLFITGTDTEVGKTYCVSLMVKYLLGKRVDVFPFKPIAAGTQHCIELANLELNKVMNAQVNEDALCLYNAVQKRYTLSQINPIVFEQPIAPHIAAKLEKQSLDISRLDNEFKQVEHLGDVQLIEGAGGWHLPLNDSELLSEWVAEQGLPVIMVVGIKLGCLNHALLTAQAIEQSGCKLIGWIANFIDGDSPVAKENALFLKQKLTAPQIAEIQQGQMGFD
jgi:dethiobiotin synthetase